MSALDKPTMSVSFYDPEAEPVPEPETAPAPKPRPDPSLRTGPRPQKKKPKKKIKWFNIWRAFFWAVVSLVAVTSTYRGVQGWLGQSAAYLALTVSLLIAAFLLDRDWKRMRKK